jgi:hypothetical protein
MLAAFDDIDDEAGLAQGLGNPDGEFGVIFDEQQAHGRRKEGVSLGDLKRDV